MTFNFMPLVILFGLALLLVGRTNDQQTQQTALGRAARPREIADMTVFLASDRSAYTSGVIVTIDGARQ